MPDIYHLIRGSISLTFNVEEFYPNYWLTRYHFYYKVYRLFHIVQRMAKNCVKNDPDNVIITEWKIKYKKPSIDYYYLLLPL